VAKIGQGIMVSLDLSLSLSLSQKYGGDESTNDKLRAFKYI
jgi:hypothetical protein